jgi:hypothetical protein
LQKGETKQATDCTDRTDNAMAGHFLPYYPCDPYKKR